MKHFIICNSGAAGSKWISVLLSALEIPTSHEQCDPYKGYAQGFQSLSYWRFIGESNHLASARMPEFPSQLIVFYQYKERQKVIDDLVKDGWFRDGIAKGSKDKTDMQSLFLMRQFPAIRKRFHSSTKRVGYMYDKFMKFAQQRADFIYDIESFNVDTLHKMMTLIEAPREYLNRQLLERVLKHIPFDVNLSLNIRQSNRWGEIFEGAEQS